MIVVLIGPPGSGKGTQATLLADHFRLAHIGTGELIRSALAQKDELVLGHEETLKNGQLVPDELVNHLIHRLMMAKTPPPGMVLDGYPRTVTQAIWFDQLLQNRGQRIASAIEFAISDEEVIRRISGRWYSPSSGATYHVIARPPKVPGICDKDGSKLVQRPDDQPETVRKRLAIYHSTCDALIAYYRSQGLLKQYSSVDNVNAVQTAVRADLARFVT
jgi:adenylate kinase